MMYSIFLDDLSLTELENLSKEVKEEIESRKKTEQLACWEKVQKAIDEYLSKGYSITFKMWDDDYTVNKADWYPHSDAGVLDFEGERVNF